MMKQMEEQSCNQKYYVLHVIILCMVLVVPGLLPCMAQAAAPVKVKIDWDKTILVSRSTATLQVVVNPMLRRGSPIHDAAFNALKQLGADDVRYVPWLPYPRLSVAELEPPTSTGTSWDFSLIDPMTEDFMNATASHRSVMNFSTTPAWMWKTEKPVTYPKDPDQVTWDYTQGTELKDPTGKQLGDYYARLVSWYTRGGFTDENGKFYRSSHHYDFPIWEVLNEVDLEHHMTPEQYTKCYDAIVSAIHKVSPDTQFMGLALAGEAEPHWFEYFLNHANHRPGIPLDYISYHFYANPAPTETVNEWQYTFFDQAKRFLAEVSYINAIRDRLSPETKTDTNELGIILPHDNARVADASGHIASIPNRYWNAAAALYAYLYIGLAKAGVDIIGESQLVGYPSQFPSVSMIDWTNGKPNARYWVLKLIKDNLHPGDKIVETKINTFYGLTAQAFLTPVGKRLLVVNQTNRDTQIELPEAASRGETVTVDEASGDDAPREVHLQGREITLAPFAVTLVKW